jgi:hypothetical protein
MGVHHDRVGELFGEPVDGFLPSVGRAVVNDPKHAVAEAYGSWVMTCSTSAVHGSMPVVASYRPWILAQWAS